MTRKFHVIIERDEDGYFVGLVPELPGCHTQAKSLDMLQERLKEAIRLLPGGRDRHPRESAICRDPADRSSALMKLKPLPSKLVIQTLKKTRL